MITGTISSKGQITIPKKIRELLNVGTSDKIVFVPLEEGKVMITSKQNPAAPLFGMLKHRRPARPVSLKKMESAIQKRRAKRKP
jgi:antitoxin PrlF